MASLAPLMNQPHAAFRANLSLQRCRRLSLCSLLPPSSSFSFSCSRPFSSSATSRIFTVAPNLLFRCFVLSRFSPVSGGWSIFKAGNLRSSHHQFVRHATAAAAEIQVEWVFLLIFVLEGFYLYYYWLGSFGIDSESPELNLENCERFMWFGEFSGIFDPKEGASCLCQTASIKLVPWRFLSWICEVYFLVFWKRNVTEGLKA